MHVIKDFISENKKKILILLLVVISVVIIYVIFDKKNEVKVYGTESYVFVKESYEHDNGLVSELPYINIMGDDIREINNDLIRKYYEVITVDDRIMTYFSYRNKNIISLIVKLYYGVSPDSYPSEVLIYNVDIETGNIIDDDELLNMYNVSKYDVSDIIRDEINEYYLYELRNNYISDDCDFECYLDMTDSLPFDNCKYYIKDNTLMAYKSISVDSDFFYDVNSGFYLFNFRIKEKK